MFRHTHISIFKSLLLAAVLALLSIAALLLYANVQILQYDNIVPIDGASTSSVVIVFGGGIEASGEQTIMQQDRVATAVDLFLNGHAPRILLSGDDGANRFDEVSAMYDQALSYGVPETALLLDPHGYRTYESCWRAARVFHVSSAIVVSHAFHLPRIQYLCESFGIDTVAVAADIRAYDAWVVSVPREILARFKAWWQVEVTKPLPRVTY